MRANSALSCEPFNGSTTTRLGPLTTPPPTSNPAHRPLRRPSRVPPPHSHHRLIPPRVFVRHPRTARRPPCGEQELKSSAEPIARLRSRVVARLARPRTPSPGTLPWLETVETDMPYMFVGHPPISKLLP